MGKKIIVEKGIWVEFIGNSEDIKQRWEDLISSKALKKRWDKGITHLKKV